MPNIQRKIQNDHPLFSNSPCLVLALALHLLASNWLLQCQLPHAIPSSNVFEGTNPLLRPQLARHSSIWSCPCQAFWATLLNTCCRNLSRFNRSALPRHGGLKWTGSILFQLASHGTARVSCLETALTRLGKEGSRPPFPGV
jgi:hypothetical protein